MKPQSAILLRPIPSFFCDLLPLLITLSRSCHAHLPIFFPFSSHHALLPLSSSSQLFPYSTLPLKRPSSKFFSFYYLVFFLSSSLSPILHLLSSYEYISFSFSFFSSFLYTFFLHLSILLLLLMHSSSTFFLLLSHSLSTLFFITHPPPPLFYYPFLIIIHEHFFIFF